MKKLFLALLFLVIPFVAFSQSGSVYIDGYEDLAWGSSVETVRSKYSDLTLEISAECQNGETCYSAGSGTTTRVFRFYNNKLYWVRVIYDGISQTQFDALTNKLIDKYGEIDWYIEEQDSVKFGYEWWFTSDLTLILTVQSKINTFGKKLGEWIFVEYASPSIREEMELSEANSIEL